MKEQLGSCAEHLRKAVRHLALSSGTPQTKLMSMCNNTGLRTIPKDHFPNGPLKDSFLAIMSSLITSTERKVAVNIACMTDDEAAKVIKQIRELSDDVARAMRA
jgi:hypothetical protein